MRPRAAAPEVSLPRLLLPLTDPFDEHDGRNDMRIKSAVGAIAVMLGTAIAVIAPTGSAGAVGNCPGDGYVQRTYTHNGATVAVLCFNDYGNGDQATLQAVGQYRGVAKKMSLSVCKWDGSPYDCVRDTGTYSYYAGPITMPGGCMHFRSVMYTPGGTKIVDSTWVLCN